MSELSPSLHKLQPVAQSSHTYFSVSLHPTYRKGHEVRTDSFSVPSTPKFLWRL